MRDRRDDPQTDLRRAADQLMQNKISSSLTSIDTKVEFVIKGQLKIIYAMIGLVASSIGLKFVGTPFIVVLMIYVAIFTAVFLALTTFAFRKSLSRLQIVFRIIFAVFIMFSAICREWVFKVGLDPTPYWYSVIVDIIFIALSAVMVWIAATNGNHKPKKGTK